jgi:hypothetical protein
VECESYIVWGVQIVVAYFDELLPSFGQAVTHFTTSRKVAGSIPVGVIGIFHLHNLSGRTLALSSTQGLTKMSTRYISWRVKVAGA